MRVSTRIGLNHGVRWVGTIGHGIISLAMVPFLLRALGTETYGVAGLLTTIVGLCAMVDLGLRTALARHLAEELARARAERFRDLLGSAFHVALLAGGLAGLLWLLLAPLATAAFNVPPAIAADAALALRWYAALAIPLSFIVPVYSAVLFAAGRSDVADGTVAFTVLWQAIGLFVAVKLGYATLNAWAAVMLSEQLLRVVLLRHAARRIVPFARGRHPGLRRATLVNLFSTGRYAFMLQVMYAVGLYADPLILTTLLGPSAVAIYRAGTVLPLRIQPLVNLADHLQPFATRYYVGAQTAKLQETLIKGTRYTLLLGILPCVILGVFADPIAHVWLGRALGDDYRIVATVLRAWVVVELLGSAGGAHWSVFQAVNKLRFLAWTQIPFAVLNVTLSCVLVGWTSVGVVGVVLGTIVAAGIRRPMLAVYAARACDLSVRSYVKQAYARPLAVLALLASLAICYRALDFVGPVALVAGVALTAIAWAALTWWVGFTREDRETVWSFFGQAIRALRFQRAFQDPAT